MIYINQIGQTELGRGETLGEAIADAAKWGFEVDAGELREWRPGWPVESPRVRGRTRRHPRMDGPRGCRVICQMEIRRCAGAPVGAERDRNRQAGPSGVVWIASITPPGHF